jgi:hypothetical protein
MKIKYLLLTKCYYNALIKKDGIGGVCSTHGKKRNRYKLLIRKTEGKRPRGRSVLT